MATLFEQIRGRLTPAQQSWLVGVWGPMSLYVMGLKGWRVAGLDGPASWWTLVILERSELFLCLAVLLVGFGLFCLARSRNTTRVVGIGLQLVAVVVVVANTVSHQFFMSTGSTMDGSLFWFGVDHFMNERHVISSEVPAATLAMLAGSVVYVAAVPPWLAYRRRHSDDDERASAPRHMAAPWRWRRPLSLSVWPRCRPLVSTRAPGLCASQPSKLG